MGQTKIFILGRTVSVRHPTLLKLKSFLFCIFSVMKTLSVEDDDDEERYIISSDENDDDEAEDDDDGDAEDDGDEEEEEGYMYHISG